MPAETDKCACCIAVLLALFCNGHSHTQVGSEFNQVTESESETSRIGYHELRKSL